MLLSWHGFIDLKILLSCEDHIIVIYSKNMFKSNILVKKCGYVFTKTGVLITQDVGCFKRIQFLLCAQMFSLIKSFHTVKLNMTCSKKFCVLWQYKKIVIKTDKCFSLQSNSWLAAFFALRGKTTQVLIYIVTFWTPTRGCFFI